MSWTSDRWRRIIPAAFLMYTIAYIDRTNYSLAIPSLQAEFGLNAGEAGVGAGVFFIGYLLLQLPGGHLAQVWSAKRIVFGALLVWGAFATACGLATSFEQLLVFRFLLGVGEGAVWPATIVLLSQWFRADERARANGYWVLCQPVAVVISSPMAGWLIDVYSWREMFIVQGVLPLVFAPLWWRAVEDRPSQARWASDDALAVETHAAKSSAGSADRGSWAFLRLRDFWLLVALDVAFACGAYGLLMWLPSTIRSLGLESNLLVGVLSGLPYVFAVAGAIYNSRRSDRAMERRRHVAVPCMVAGAALVASFAAAESSPALALAFVCVTAAGIYAAIGPMWALMLDVVPVAGVGLSLGLINAVANLGGLIGPYVVGAARDATGGFLAGMLFLGASLAVSGLLTLLLPRQPSVLLLQAEAGHSTSR